MYWLPLSICLVYFEWLNVYHQPRLLPVSFSFIKKKVQKNPAKLAAIFDSIKGRKPILLARIAGNG
jgi:hypothetical protein